MHQLYSFSYLYKITSTSNSFIRKMVRIFISSLEEYVMDLENLQSTRNLEDLKKVIHKMKPSMLNLEVKGAAEELELLSKARNWNTTVDSSVLRLLTILHTIKPFMQQDLDNLPEGDG